MKVQGLRPGLSCLTLNPRGLPFLPPNCHEATSTASAVFSPGHFLCHSAPRLDIFLPLLLRTSLGRKLLLFSFQFTEGPEVREERGLLKVTDLP